MCHDSLGEINFTVPTVLEVYLCSTHSAVVNIVADLNCDQVCINIVFSGNKVHYITARLLVGNQNSAICGI